VHVKAKKLSAVLLTLVALVAGIVLAAGVAFAAPAAPTTPYPDPNPNAVAVGDVCDVENSLVVQARLTYKEAVAAYGVQKTVSDKGVGPTQALRAAQKAVDVAAIALNTATYTLAACQNTAVNKVNKDCVNLALELNRRIDQLAINQDLEAIAKDNLDATAKLVTSSDAEELRTATYAYELAKEQTKEVQLRITAQRKKIPADCKNVDRPPVAPPKPAAPPQPTSTDAPPTDTATAGTPTDSPSDTTTPSDTTSTSPAPIPSAS
jgi:hypothetical protein